MSQPSLPDACRTSQDRRRILVLQGRKGEKGPRFIAENPNERLLAVYRVDNCCLKTEACDDLILLEDSDAWVIERKGSDLSKAIAQLNSTLDALGPALHPRNLHARIVLNRVRTPDLGTTEEKRLKKRVTSYNRRSQELREVLP